jgi:acetylornithine/succinyldiaminopimelate/putrescine aminotransferase
MMVQGHRDGVRIWDLDGKAYLNCRSSGGVFDFGHRPDFAIRALTRALERWVTSATG